MNALHVIEPVEVLYLSLMLRWERTAPPDGHQGLLDGEPERNSQISRMAYVLRKIAAGDEERTYQHLSRHSRRNDSHSYVSKSHAWMTSPYPLSGGWHFEGCTSLDQKQSILQHLTGLRLSPAFVACANDFVAGISVEKYLPTAEECQEILRTIEQREQQALVQENLHSHPLPTSDTA